MIFKIVLLELFNTNKQRKFVMKLSLKSLLILFMALGVLTSCTSEQQVKDQVAKVIKENPKIITDAIRENPAEFVSAFQDAVKNAQDVLAKKREEEEQKKLDEAFENPLKPKIRDDEAIRGNKSAPLVLVEYSDFECPFCSRGFATVQQLREKYGDKIQFIYKHLPLSFHDKAMISAQYFEAIRLQDSEKAFKFHDQIFENQRKLKNGETFLKEIAKQVGADMTKLGKDLNSETVKNRIEDDMKEAAAFGMQGTPGFLLNGIPVKGAYPAEHFYDIVEKLKAKGKLSL